MVKLFNFLTCLMELLFIFQLQMLGYDISWAGFNVIEVMSSSKFTFKRIGYLAASQSFHEDSEVNIYFFFSDSYLHYNIFIISVINVDNKYDSQRFKQF